MGVSRILGGGGAIKTSQLRESQVRWCALPSNAKRAAVHSSDGGLNPPEHRHNLFLARVIVS